MSDDNAIQDEVLDFVEIDAASRPRFVEAWELSFARQLPSEVYDWIFCARNRLFAVMSGQTVAAGYGLMPLEGMLAGRQARIALCNNVFVAPDYRSRMLFSRLGRHALQTVGRDGVDAAFGMPNPEAVPGHRRVGWSMEPLPFLARPRRASAPAASQPPVAWQAQPPTDAELQAIERCSRRSAAGRSFSIIKTADHFRWRLIQRPATRYQYAMVQADGEVRAYAVVKVYEPRGFLHVVDIDGDDPAAVDALIASLDAVPGAFTDINVWGATAFRSSFEAGGFTLSAEAGNLILIDPVRMKGFAQGAPGNIVLADNDVY